MTWRPSTFLRATFHGPVEASGYEYRSLGLVMVIQGSPKGRRPPTWLLIHLGTGHAVCRIDGDVKTAFPAATAIAECADWSFTGLNSWRNIDPELMEKFIGVSKQYPQVTLKAGSGGKSDDVAREIAMARA